MKKRLLILLIPVVLSALAAIWILYPKATREAVFTAVDGSEEDDASYPEETLERLMSLPYLSTVSEDPNPEKKGVAHHDPEAAYFGLNLYCSSSTAKAFLMDMEGDILHTINVAEESGERLKIKGGCKMIEPYDGNKFLVTATPWLKMMTWDSRILWRWGKGKHHHDFAVLDNGDIYAMMRRRGEISYKSRILPIDEDAIDILTPEGKLKKTVSLLKLFREFVPEDNLEKILSLEDNNKLKRRDFPKEENREKTLIRPLKDKPLDIFHSNSIEVISRDITVAQKGDVLLCLRNINLIAIVNLEREEIVWTWGSDVLDYPHHPSLLDNNHILIFDNGPSRKYSRVIEMDPVTGEIVWTYQAAPPEDFYSEKRGSAQRLPNDNILVTESNKGHVFEIDREGKIVWDFWNPHFAEKAGHQRRAIYRMTRLPREVLRGIEMDKSVREILAAREYF